MFIHALLRGHAVIIGMAKNQWTLHDLKDLGCVRVVSMFDNAPVWIRPVDHADEFQAFGNRPFAGTICAHPGTGFGHTVMPLQSSGWL